MEIKTKYNLGDTVQLKTDSDKFKRIITSISFRGSKEIPLYGLSLSDTGDTFHYDYEFEKYNKNNKKKVTGFGKSNKK